MSTARYQNREIDDKLAAILAKIDFIHKETIDAISRVDEKATRIETQTTKTNGRVTQLEKDTGESGLVKKIVFGCVTLILVSVVTALIYLVIKK